MSNSRDILKLMKSKNKTETTDADTVQKRNGAEKRKRDDIKYQPSVLPQTATNITQENTYIGSESYKIRSTLSLLKEKELERFNSSLKNYWLRNAATFDSLEDEGIVSKSLAYIRNQSSHPLFLDITTSKFAKHILTQFENLKIEPHKVFMQKKDKIANPYRLGMNGVIGGFINETIFSEPLHRNKTEERRKFAKIKSALDDNILDHKNRGVSYLVNQLQQMERESSETSPIVSMLQVDMNQLDAQYPCLIVRISSDEYHQKKILAKSITNDDSAYSNFVTHLMIAYINKSLMKASIKPLFDRRQSFGFLTPTGSDVGPAVRLSLGLIPSTLWLDTVINGIKNTNEALRDLWADKTLENGVSPTSENRGKIGLPYSKFKDGNIDTYGHKIFLAQLTNNQSNKDFSEFLNILKKLNDEEYALLFRSIESSQHIKPKTKKFKADTINSDIDSDLIDILTLIENIKKQFSDLSSEIKKMDDPFISLATVSVENSQVTDSFATEYAELAQRVKVIYQKAIDIAQLPLKSALLPDCTIDEDKVLDNLIEIPSETDNTPDKNLSKTSTSSSSYHENSSPSLRQLIREFQQSAIQKTTSLEEIDVTSDTYSENGTPSEKYLTPTGMSALFTPLAAMMLANQKLNRKNPVRFKMESYAYFELNGWENNLKKVFAKKDHDNPEIIFVDNNPCVNDLEPIKKTLDVIDAYTECKVQHVPDIIVVDVTSSTIKQIRKIVEEWNNCSIPMLVFASSGLKHKQFGFDMAQYGENRVFINVKTVNSSPDAAAKLERLELIQDYFKKITRATVSPFTTYVRRTLEQAAYETFNRSAVTRPSRQIFKSPEASDLLYPNDPTTQRSLIEEDDLTQPIHRP